MTDNMRMQSDLPNPATYQLPAVIARNERIVEKSFWRKLLKLAGNIPFAEDLAAAYYCAVDPATPYVAAYEPADAGKIAHYMLRWRMQDGSLGPWGETVSATITG